MLRYCLNSPKVVKKKAKFFDAPANLITEKKTKAVKKAENPYCFFTKAVYSLFCT